MKYVILAGGTGTRLWPLSRKKFPKQFLRLTNQNSMLQNTALRVSNKNGKDIFIISSKNFMDIIHNQLTEVLNDFNIKNIIVEPVGRNTAPAIAYGSLFFKNEDIVAVLSSDHYIKDEKLFNDILLKAEKLALDDYIVTLGIIPDSPKTGYGYIKKSEKKIGEGFFVERFEEKPTIEKAKEYIKEGNYFWNAGIFIFKIGFFLEELKKYDPEIFTTLEKIKEKKEKKEIITEDDFMMFKSISIDYSLMEKTKKLIVIPSDFGWNDIGSFKSLYEVQDKDRSNNSIKMNRDDFINIDSKNLLVIGENKQITAINLKNLAIIDTKDALLISNLDNSEKVKSVYERLVEKNSKTCENHLKITTDWGQSEILIDQTDYLIRKIIINTDKAVDLYKNDKRTKNITVLSGSLELIYKNDKKILKEKDSINIQPDEKIKLICKTKSVEFLEVSFN